MARTRPRCTCKKMTSPLVEEKETHRLSYSNAVRSTQEQWESITTDTHQKQVEHVCPVMQKTWRLIIQKNIKSSGIAVVALWTILCSQKNILIQKNSLIHQYIHLDQVWITSGLIEDLCLPLWEGELFRVSAWLHHIALRTGSEDTTREFAHWHHHYTPSLLKTPVCITTSECHVRSSPPSTESSLQFRQIH